MMRFQVKAGPLVYSRPLTAPRVKRSVEPVLWGAAGTFVLILLLLWIAA